MKNYDSWLEAPYQRMYAQEPSYEALELLDQEVWIEEEDAWCEIEGYETWEDADEDGRYGGIDLVIRMPSGHTENRSMSDIEGLPLRDKSTKPKEK